MVLCFFFGGSAGSTMVVWVFNFRSIKLAAVRTAQTKRAIEMIFYLLHSTFHYLLCYNVIMNV